MSEPYRPSLSADKHLPAQCRQAMQEASDRRYDAAGITQEIIETARGFRWAFYKHGVEIPNGIQGLADAL